MKSNPIFKKIEIEIKKTKLKINIIYKELSRNGYIFWTSRETDIQV